MEHFLKRFCGQPFPWSQRFVVQRLPRLRKQYRLLVLLLSTLLLTGFTALPVRATSPIFMQLPGFSGSGGGSAYKLAWVEMDGYKTFQISAPQSAIKQRAQDVSQNLRDIRDNYLQLETQVARVATQDTEEGQPAVYVNGQYLMTITQSDANLRGTTLSGVTQQLEQSIPAILDRAYEQRQPAYRRRQFVFIGIAAAIAIAAMVTLYACANRLLRWAMVSLGASLDQAELSQNQRHQLTDLKNRLLPIGQGFILAGTLLWAMGRFPETRVIQQDWLSVFKVPIIVSIVVLVAYVGIRLTYAIVDRVLMGMTDEDGLSGQYSRRTRLRISTLSSVIKNIANFIWIAIGFILALTVTGVDIGLLLASVGIIGLALSLAAQNLVKGAIQGFFIVLEDQFAIGDVVKIGPDAGVVENLNLRITQLRDTEGRLITIPTSDITRVANYSLHWSQADLKLPVHYKADINHILAITRQVGEELRNDAEWGLLILEDPQILGVDEFDDNAIIIRVWIKTQPMKQWDVSREYRRRFKLALQAAETSIPFPQRDVWLHPSDEFLANLRSWVGDRPQNSQEQNGKHATVKTDRQPRAVPDEDGDGDGEGE